jgi:acetyl-CoA carboxylase carboxyl transferase subunit alpha
MPRPGYSPLYQLDFENPVLEIERQIDEIEERADAELYTDELAQLNETRTSLLTKAYANLTPWQTVRIARHPLRPQTIDYTSLICRDFCELHGDRCFGDDPAIISGFARIGSMKCMFIGHHKGKTVAEKVSAHFGCAHPEGYRKAMLKMKLAAKLGLPIVTLIDTPGAYPGIGSEQRGQAQAIAVNLMEMSRLRTPIVSVVIGEGGSGGALGIAVADRVAMLEHAWYSVISPEGCAAILWKESNEQTNNRAAECLALTARRNLENGLVDDVIAEPLGGAHRDPRKAADRLQTWIVDRLRDLSRVNPETLVRQRFEKFRRMGSFHDELAVTVNQAAH